MKETEDIAINKLFDPNFGTEIMDLELFDPRKPLPIPDHTHTLATSRKFLENEKSDMFSGLEILRQCNQLNRYDQNETYKQKAIDVGIFICDFEHKQEVKR